MNTPTTKKPAADCDAVELSVQCGKPSCKSCHGTGFTTRVVKGKSVEVRCFCVKKTLVEK